MAKASNLIKFAAFKSEADAIAMLESLRWPNGVACPHCGGMDPYKLTPKATSKKPGRPGLYKCSACRRQFTVRIPAIVIAQSGHRDR